MASGGKPVFAGEAIYWAPDILLLAAVVSAVVGTLLPGCKFQATLGHSPK